MTQKEHEEEKKRLVELLSSMTYFAPKDYINRLDIDWCADYLLSHGTITPSCKVGDTVYSIGWLNGLVKEEKILYFTYNSRLDNFVFVTGVGHFDANQIGKFIFLTREAAERALKEPET